MAIVGVARSKHKMAEKSNEALEISSYEESGTDKDDTKDSMDQWLQSGFLTIFSLLDHPRSQTPADYPERASTAKSSS